MADHGLEGKVALVTGASRGMGAEIARALARQGAIVALNSRSGAAGLAQEIASLGGKALDLKADIASEAEVAEMFGLIRQSFGEVDILINNACAPLTQVPFQGIGWESFQAQLDVSLKGSFNCIKQAVPGMVSKGKGRIVSILSSYSIGVPPASLSHYLSAKYALLGLSKSLAVELGPKGITVNMVSPGLTRTEMTSALPEMALTLAARQNPLRRIGEPADAAASVIFLCSDAASYINGVNLPVCGGSVMP